MASKDENKLVANGYSFLKGCYNENKIKDYKKDDLKNQNYIDATKKLEHLNTTTSRTPTSFLYMSTTDAQTKTTPAKHCHAPSGVWLNTDKEFTKSGLLEKHVTSFYVDDELANDVITILNNIKTTEKAKKCSENAFFHSVLCVFLKSERLRFVTWSLIEHNQFSRVTTSFPNSILCYTFRLLLDAWVIHKQHTTDKQQTTDKQEYLKQLTDVILNQTIQSMDNKIMNTKETPDATMLQDCPVETGIRKALGELYTECTNAGLGGLTSLISPGEVHFKNAIKENIYGPIVLDIRKHAVPGLTIQSVQDLFMARFLEPPAFFVVCFDAETSEKELKPLGIINVPLVTSSYMKMFVYKQIHCAGTVAVFELRTHTTNTKKP